MHLTIDWFWLILLFIKVVAAKILFTGSKYDVVELNGVYIGLFPEFPANKLVNNWLFATKSNLPSPSKSPAKLVY